MCANDDDDAFILFRRSTESSTLKNMKETKNAIKGFKVNLSLTLIEILSEFMLGFGFSELNFEASALPKLRTC